MKEEVAGVDIAGADNDGVDFTELSCLLRRLHRRLTLLQQRQMNLLTVAKCASWHRVKGLLYSAMRTCSLL